MSTRESLRAVLNTSPIIVLSKLGLIENTVKLVFEEAEIPRDVLIELEEEEGRGIPEGVGARGKGAYLKLRRFLGVSHDWVSASHQRY